MLKLLARPALILAVAVGLTSCGESSSGAQGYYMLLDTSGTYARELQQAQKIILAILTRLEPGDSFAVARIDTGSFSEKDIVAKVTLDDRPSVANQQKRLFQAEVANFIKSVKPAQYTDITGGILQGSEFLIEKRAGRKTIVIYSDLQEELKKGFVRKGLDFELDGFRVVALNVTKLRTDNIDPRIYLKRLEQWQARVEKGGGEWQVINNLDNLDELMPS
ncbi:MAG: hypothetical protein JSU82_17165 [Rhodospirillales bacterium]|nr:MAG: hypothetical protein JSU82_17165 [Rhodospirillales bacterium]